jgi:hypothetical protein
MCFIVIVCLPLLYLAAARSKQTCQAGSHAHALRIPGLYCRRVASFDALLLCVNNQVVLRRTATNRQIPECAGLLFVYGRVGIQTVSGVDGSWMSVCFLRASGKEALKSGLNIPGVAESYDEGGNLTSARWAKGLKEGEQLPPSSW